MKRLLYLILKKDMIKKLSEKHGEQFIDNVMETFKMPTNILAKRRQASDKNYQQSMELYLNDLKINKKMLENELSHNSEDIALIYERTQNTSKQIEIIKQRMFDANNEILKMSNSDLPSPN